MYSYGFRTFIYTHEDEAEFDALLEQASRNSQQD